MKRHTGSRAVLPASLFALMACIMGVALFVVGGASASPQSGKSAEKLTLYSVATEEQFVNNADDRQRGKGNNPFGNFKDLTATTKEHGNGPFPGDEALFEFKVYASKDLKTTTGLAILTCQYNFNKHAFCDGTYQLSGGTLIAAGGLDFNAPSFTLAITGGTGKYRGRTGDLESSPGSYRFSQRLVITLN